MKEGIPEGMTEVGSDKPFDPTTLVSPAFQANRQGPEGSDPLESNSSGLEKKQKARERFETEYQS